MNHKGILDQLNKQLAENIKNYYNLLKKNQSEPGNTSNKTAIFSLEKVIQALLKLIQKELLISNILL